MLVLCRQYFSRPPNILLGSLPSRHLSTVDLQEHSATAAATVDLPPMCPSPPSPASPPSRHRDRHSSTANFENVSRPTPSESRHLPFYRDSPPSQVPRAQTRGGAHSSQNCYGRESNAWCDVVLWTLTFFDIGLATPTLVKEMRSTLQGEHMSSRSFWSGKGRCALRLGWH